MFESIAMLPADEMALRHAKCRDFLAKVAPEAQGLFAFSRIGIYYLTGSLGNGVFWLPLEGEPVYMARKGTERARLESPLANIVPYRSYGDIPKIFAQFGLSLPEVAAAEMGALPWSMSGMFQAKLSGVRFVPGDMVLSRAQALKSPWELERMRLCGDRHRQAMEERLPALIKPGMSELDIAILISDLFLKMGHYGMLRMAGHGEESYVGQVSVGDSGNYPLVNNMTLGLRGMHPSAPFMGYAGRVWKPNQLLTLDVGFVVEGYNTDKTQVYWSGPKSSIPERVQKAQEACFAVLSHVAQNMKPGAVPADFWTWTLEYMEKAGFSEGFMGLGGNKAPFLGHGIGLVIDAWPVIAKGFNEPLEEGMVMAVEPKIGIPDVGLVGVENTIEVTAAGGRSLTGMEPGFLCVE